MTAATALPAQAALTKLARVLEADDASVSFLDRLEVDTLRALRDQISDRLHEADNHRLRKVMSASRLLPIGLAAAIGEKWFGATLCARLVGLVEPARGAQFARHLSVEFMADITARTDPRVVGDLVHELPLESMQQIATMLLTRGDYLTLSHFVPHLPPAIVNAILEAIEDDAAVVRIAQYVEDLGSLDPIVALLPDGRLLALVDAVHRDDLWVEGLYLFGHLSSTQIARIAITLVELDESVLRAAIDAFHRHDLWVQGLGILTHLDGPQLRRVASLLAQIDDDLIEAAIAAAAEADIWEPLVHAAVAADHLPDAVAERLASLLDQQSPAVAARFDEAATRLGHPGLLDQLLHRGESDCPR